MAPARLLCALALALACGAAAARAPWHGAPAQAPARSLRAYSALLAVEPAESPAAIAALASAHLPLISETRLAAARHRGGDDSPSGCMPGACVCARGCADKHCMLMQRLESLCKAYSIVVRLDRLSPPGSGSELAHDGRCGPRKQAHALHSSLSFERMPGSPRCAVPRRQRRAWRRWRPRGWRPARSPRRARRPCSAAPTTPAWPSCP
jgi:hypothetical protein